MSKIYTAGIAAIFAAVAIAATTVPAAANNHHHHHNGHWGHGWNNGIYLGFGGPTILVDRADPVYCVDRRGRLFVCGYN